jgi:hypothetical protein
VFDFLRRSKRVGSVTVTEKTYQLNASPVCFFCGREVELTETKHPDAPWGIDE